jgi:uncharacterized membrane protein YoaK (UPF0700 family)
MRERTMTTDEWYRYCQSKKDQRYDMTRRQKRTIRRVLFVGLFVGFVAGVIVGALLDLQV